MSRIHKCYQFPNFRKRVTASVIPGLNSQLINRSMALKDFKRLLGAGWWKYRGAVMLRKTNRACFIRRSK